MKNMLRLFLSLYLVLALILLMATLRSCSDDGGKKEPEYHGVDPQLKPLVDEYLLISSRNNIVFNNEVTVGMKDIDDGGAVGICNYGKNWREIDIDKTFWQNASELTKKATLFHELTHCYCTRDHDYADGKMYKSVKELNEETKKGMDHEGDGFFPDNCPTSLMYPIVVDNACMEFHGDYYLQEMLDRCEPF